ncbi:MAG TPA: class I SAM-dependent methyltransferase, partial [Cyanothece sp. UBA12306]|nr:class I SAM-dependent methyltransferase [Cyanothece sp. UBA12306]
MLSKNYVLKSCPICDYSMKPTRHSWLFRCVNCGFLQSILEPNIESQEAGYAINETKREVALKQLRIANFQRILESLEDLVEPQSKRLLEVGCAHGWFLELAAERGFTVFGIEPDLAMSNTLATRFPSIWHGFFPQNIPEGEKFDLIVFNDVFEHLPNVTEAMNSCRSLLHTGGILIINLPCQTGIFYRVAALLDRLGISGPLERMWQKKFASPHLSYFTPLQLQKIANKFGFR